MPRFKRRFEIYKDESYENSVKPFLADIELMALDGYSIAQMARALKVEHNAFYKFTKTHPELRAAIEEGYIKTERQLESSMIKAAKGQHYTEEKEITKYDADGNLIYTQVEKFKKYRPPNTMLLMNMLRHINKERWGKEDDTKDKEYEINFEEDLEVFDSGGQAKEQ